MYACVYVYAYIYGYGPICIYMKYLSVYIYHKYLCVYTTCMGIHIGTKRCMYI